MGLPSTNHHTVICSVKFHSPAMSITTAMLALSLLASLVAVITTVSDSTRPVTKPVGVTVARAGELLVHVTGRSTSSWPAASLTLAVSCSVWPITTPAVGGVISTEATGAGGGVGSLPQATSRAKPARGMMPALDAVVMALLLL